MFLTRIASDRHDAGHCDGSFAGNTGDHRHIYLQCGSVGYDHSLRGKIVSVTMNDSPDKKELDWVVAGGGSIGNNVGYDLQTTQNGLYSPYDAKVVGDYTGLTPPFEFRRHQLESFSSTTCHGCRRSR
jgi:hypothetical protein